jgi:hypothetical protein
MRRFDPFYSNTRGTNRSIAATHASSRHRYFSTYRILNFRNLRCRFFAFKHRVPLHPTFWFETSREARSPKVLFCTEQPPGAI